MLCKSLYKTNSSIDIDIRKFQDLTNCMYDLIKPNVSKSLLEKPSYPWHTPFGKYLLLIEEILLMTVTDAIKDKKNLLTCICA